MATSSASRPQGPGSSVSTAIGRVTAKTSQGHPSTDVVAEPGEYDGFPLSRRAFHRSLQRADLFAMIAVASSRVRGAISEDKR